MSEDILNKLESFVGLPYDEENVERFQRELEIPDDKDGQLERFKEINSAMKEVSMKDAIELGMFYQRFMADVMKGVVETDPDFSKVISYDFNPDMNFADKDFISSGKAESRPRLLALLFKIKFNQMKRILRIGYNLPPGEQNIIESSYPYGEYIEMLSRKYNNLKEEIDGIDQLDYRELLLLNNEIYVNDDGVQLPCYYITKNPKNTQININTIEELAHSIQSFVRQGDIIKRIMIVAMDKISSDAINLLSNINYLSAMTPGVEEDVFSELRDIKFEIFTTSELFVDVTESSIVPDHRLMSQEEVDDLLENTGWTLDNLQGMSYFDPVAKYLAFEIDDVIEIKRKSAVGIPEITDHSYAYRVVRPVPMYMSVDASNAKRYMR